MSVGSMLALLSPRSSAVEAVDLDEAATTAVVGLCVAVLTAANAVLVGAPRPHLVLASLLNVVDDSLECLTGRLLVLEAGWEHHLNGSDQRHGSVVAGCVRVAILEAALGNEFRKAGGIGHVAPVASLA